MICHYTKKSKPQPSKLYDTYWKFAEERQKIFFKRFHGGSYPWTEDSVLRKYKFTNVYRATDRVSQYLIKHVIYTGDQQPDELLFRIMLFKTFNRISTWEFLKKKMGNITYRAYSFQKYDRILSQLLEDKHRIYSAAYIMASGRSFFGLKRKHQNHLRLIEKMLKDQVSSKLQECTTMHDAYRLLLSYPTIGEFLAYQYVIDINYSVLTDFSEMEFVKAGPGAKDGISKCFKNFGDYASEDIIKMMTEEQKCEFERLNIDFNNLWGRDLQLIDCQNIFCEVDKYTRVGYPRIHGHSQRTRVKQKYNPTEQTAIPFYFPPKWNIKVPSNPRVIKENLVYSL